MLQSYEQKILNTHTFQREAQTFAKLIKMTLKSSPAKLTPPPRRGF